MQAIKIDWKSDSVNLTKKFKRVFDNGEVEEMGSFFNFFEQAEDPTDVSFY